VRIRYERRHSLLFKAIGVGLNCAFSPGGNNDEVGGDERTARLFASSARDEFPDANYTAFNSFSV